MGLKKNSPGCNCCGGCCTELCNRTLASLDVELDWVGGPTVTESFTINKAPNQICFAPYKIGCFGPWLKTTLSGGSCVTSGSTFIADFNVAISLPNADVSTPAALFSFRCGTTTKETVTITASGSYNESQNWYWLSEMYLYNSGAGVVLELQYKTTAFDASLGTGCPTDATLASTIQTAIRAQAGTHPELTGAVVTVTRTEETCGEPLDTAAFTEDITVYNSSTGLNYATETIYTYTTHGALFWLSAGSVNSVLFQTVRLQFTADYNPAFPTVPLSGDTTIARQITLATLAFPNCCGKQALPTVHKGAYLNFDSATGADLITTCGHPSRSPWHDWSLVHDGSTTQRYLGRCEESGQPYTGTVYIKLSSNYPTRDFSIKTARQIVPKVTMTPAFSDYATVISTCSSVCPRPYAEIGSLPVKIKKIEIRLFGKTYTIDSDRTYSLTPIAEAAWPPPNFSTTLQTTGTFLDYESQIAWTVLSLEESQDTCQSAVISGIKEYEEHDGELYPTNYARSVEEWTESYSSGTLTYTEVNSLDVLTAQIQIRKVAGQVAIRFFATVTSRQYRDIFWHGEYTDSGTTYYNPEITASWRSKLTRDNGWLSGTVTSSLTSSWFDVNAMADIFTERSVGTVSLISHSSGPTAAITAEAARIPPFKRDDANFRTSATSSTDTLSIKLIERT